jgi:quinolinate synthase
VFAWALAPESRGGAGASKILAIPDRHLGLNTAVAMGFGLEDCALYDPNLEQGGLSEADVRRAKFILWKGQCYVHQRFTPQQVRAVRQRHPGIRVIVHPECPREVVALADASGSTEQIIQAVTASQPGSSWAIGTESNLVNRLARRLPDRFIRTLGDAAALCIQMARIDLPHLLWVLDNLAQGRVVNQVKVAPAVAADARVALERMIAIKADISPP